MLRLHYVPGGNGSHFSGHRGQNRVTARQLEGTETTNVARRGRRHKLLNCHLTICQVLLRSATFKCPFGYVCSTTAARFVAVCHIVSRSSRRAKVKSSRFVKFSHGASRRVTIYMPFYYGQTRCTRSGQKL